MMGVIALVIVSISVFFGAKQTAQVATTPTPTPSVATGSATNNGVLSAIATESAFLKFEVDLDTLTRATANTQIQNSQLLPPRIDLPLGF